MKKEMKLAEVLEVLWLEMENKGLLSEEMKNKKDEILEKVSTLINENDVDLKHDDFSNINVQKALMTLVMSVTLGLKIDPAKVKQTLDMAKDSEDPDPKLNNDLKLTLFKLIAVSAGLDKLSPKPQPGAELKQDPDATNENSEDKKEELKHSQEESDALEKEFSDFLRSLYGGDDPRFAGEIQYAVTQIKGNLVGFAHQMAADPNSTAFMVEEITYNAGKEDPLSIEHKAAIGDLMSGAVESLTDAFSESLNTVKNRPTFTPDVG